MDTATLSMFQLLSVSVLLLCSIWVMTIRAISDGFKGGLSVAVTMLVDLFGQPELVPLYRWIVWRGVSARSLKGPHGFTVAA